MTGPEEVPRATPLINVTLADRVAEALERKIARGLARPGTKLPTVALLAGEYGVSQPVVREALSRLRSLGLISTRQGFGSVILEPRPPREFRFSRPSAGDRSALTELFAFRADVEASSAAQAALAATPADLEELCRAQLHLQRHADHGQLGLDADLSFHQAIARAGHNRYRLTLVSQLHGQMRAAILGARGHAAPRPDHALQVQREHEAVVRAIAARDADVAAAAMRAHLCEAARRLGLVAPGWLPKSVPQQLLTGPWQGRRSQPASAVSAPR